MKSNILIVVASSICCIPTFRIVVAPERTVYVTDRNNVAIKYPQVMQSWYEYTLGESGTRHYTGSKYGRIYFPAVYINTDGLSLILGALKKWQELGIHSGYGPFESISISASGYSKIWLSKRGMLLDFSLIPKGDYLKYIFLYASTYVASLDVPSQIELDRIPNTYDYNILPIENNSTQINEPCANGSVRPSEWNGIPIIGGNVAIISKGINNICYEVAGTLDNAVEYYRNSMARFAWELVDIIKNDDATYSLTYTKRDAGAIIGICQTGSDTYKVKVAISYTAKCD